MTFAADPKIISKILSDTTDVASVWSPGTGNYVPYVQISDLIIEVLVDYTSVEYAVILEHYEDIVHVTDDLRELVTLVKSRIKMN
jgi:hypothetical protein